MAQWGCAEMKFESPISNYTVVNFLEAYQILRNFFQYSFRISAWHVILSIPATSWHQNESPKWLHVFLILPMVLMKLTLHVKSIRGKKHLKYLLTVTLTMSFPLLLEFHIQGVVMVKQIKLCQAAQKARCSKQEPVSGFYVIYIFQLLIDAPTKILVWPAADMPPPLKRLMTKVRVFLSQVS